MLTLTIDSDARMIPRALGAIAASDHTCFSLAVGVSHSYNSKHLRSMRARNDAQGRFLRMLILPNLDIAPVPELSRIWKEFRTRLD
jgi:hypothetical protein